MADDLRSHGQRQLLGGVGAIGAGLFIAALPILDAWDGFPVSRTYVSDLANAPGGRVFQAVVIVHGLANLGLVAALWPGKPRGGVVCLGLGMLGVASSGVVIAGAFATDPPGAVRTLGGAIHLGAAWISFPVEAASSIVLGTAWRADRLARSASSASLLVGVATLAILGWLVAELVGGRTPGIPERLALGLLAAWELGLGVALVVGRAPGGVGSA